MGFSHCEKVKDELEDIKEFNKKFKIKDDIINTEIEKNIRYCTLHNIGQEGFNSLCFLKLYNLEILCLSENKISNIESFGHFKLICIKRLDLSFNKIKNIDIFEKVEYPLETLDLQDNEINNIDIFRKPTTLKSLKNLLLSNNNLDFNSEEIRNILSNLKNRANSNAESISENTDEENKRFIINKIKTINDKLKTSFCLHDKDLINKMRQSKNLNTEIKNDINELEARLLNFKKSSVNAYSKEILKLNENEKKKIFKTLTKSEN